MHILLVTVAYPPEVRSASHLMYELACEFRDRGNKITVLTTAPQYNIPNEKKDVINKESVIEEGIRVLRKKTLPVHKINYVMRGIGILALPFYLFRLAKRHLNHIDMIIVYSPPLTLALLGGWLKRKFKCKFILNLHDIFPQNAIDLRILRNPIVIAFFEFIERLAYNVSDYITVHSEGNLKLLLDQKNVAKERISVLHNWVDTEPFEKAKRSGLYRTKYGLNGKFVILFAGVIGPAQGLDIILPIADNLREIPDIVFLIVGDGTERERIEYQANKMNLQNIQFSGFVSKEDYPFLVKDVDVGLVCLNKDMKTPVVPGKIQTYMAGAIPVVGILNKESDGHILIRDACAGFSVEAGDVEASVDVIEKLYYDEDLRNRMGEAGRLYVNSHFSKSVCVNSLYKIFDIISSKEE